MSGYKRVNFYELCRLCATNQQKDKTHIFQEEGRKIQLQNKIQSCLSLTVCENDFLPKVVCSKCLRTLEVCYSFRQECVSSESMLSSYFKNFRYTEDFKKSGKVYIKDTATKCTVSQYQQNTEAVSSSPTSVVNTNTFATSVNEVKPMEHVPFYTLQLPAIVTNQPIDNKVVKTEINSKILQNTTNQVQGQVGYNLNTINLAAIKAIPKVGNNESLSNVVVNANGEVINIAQLVDFESIINQANMQKMKKPKKLIKEDEPVIKIDLTNSEVDGNYDTGQPNNNKIHNIKNNNQNKFAYAIKVEDNKINPSVIFNNLSEFNQSNNFSSYNNTTNTNSLYSPNLSNNLVTTPNIICNQTVEPSTVNLNVLNQDLNQSTNFNRNFQTNLPTPNQSKINLQTQTTNEEMPNSQVNNQMIKTHVCEICQKSFKRREHLYQHVKLHTGFRPYTCENCNKSFMRKEHLLRHMTSHSGQKNFTCNICDKSFSRNDNLLKHKKTHDKQASYTCDICQKQFVMKHYYLAHKLTHDSDRCSLANVWNVLKT